MGLLINLLIFVLIMGIVWWIISRIPIPAPASWVVQVIFAIICLIFLLSLLYGGFSLPYHFRN